MATDPICGMTVDEATALHAERGGQTFYFCSEHCRKKFLAETQPANRAERSCCGGNAESAPATGDCCGGHEHHGHSHHGHGEATVKPSSAAKYFCPMCPGVESDKPGDCPKCGMALERNPAWVSPLAGQAIYTCPMHPEIQQDHPGNCPKCGMALEPKTVSAVEEENPELTDMTRRFWIGAALALPVFLLAMAHWIPALRHESWVMGDTARWIQFILSTPVVLWAGWPFFKRGWRSLVTWHLNMFTLIAIGVGTAYLFSAVVMLMPGAFPISFAPEGKVGIYFEAAAVIVVLVLLGQVLELRARGKTGSAIRALLNLAPKTARIVQDNEERDVPLESVQADRKSTRLNSSHANIS